MYKILYPCFFIFLTAHVAGLERPLQKEILPNGSKIVFYSINDKPLSQKELKKIENDISSYIQNLFKRFDRQSSKQNLSALLQFKKYLDDKVTKIQYKITNTPLSSQILLLSKFLHSLPDSKSFQPKKCSRDIHRLTVKAHVSLQTNQLPLWIEQVLKLTQQLCPKNNPRSVKNKFAFYRIFNFNTSLPLTYY